MGEENLLGTWSFIIGLVLAVILGLGLTTMQTQLTWILFLLGIIVGLLNVTAEETSSFLTAGTVLAILSYVGIVVGIFNPVPVLKNILKGILTLFIPATMIVALKAVYDLAHD